MPHIIWFFFFYIHNFVLQGMRKRNISKSNSLQIFFWHTLALDLKCKQWIQIKFSIFNYLSPPTRKDRTCISRIVTILQMIFLYIIKWKRSPSLLKKYINLMWYMSNLTIPTPSFHFTLLIMSVFQCPDFLYMILT